MKNFVFKKKYGQNFLSDKNLLKAICTDAGVDKASEVLEIGAGAGSLTEVLSEFAKKVVSFEIDKDLQEQLLGLGLSNVEFVFEDFMKKSMEDVEKLFESEFKVVANLPYYITTPIIMGLFESHVPLESITIMVQKEVADRMQVGPGTKDYGALSLAVQYYANPQIVLMVPASCFMPRPNVDSAVIKLTCHHKPPVSVKNEKFMFDIIRASFNQRRKTMTNSVVNANLGITKEQLLIALQQCGLKPTIRGEALTLQQFAQLSNELSCMLSNS